MKKGNNRKFLTSTKVNVLGRAGYICSHPTCVLNLIGPKSDSLGTISISEVSHIEGANKAPNNRFNPNLSDEKCKHISNAIALCRNHAKIIDSDQEYFTVELLKQWKIDHEAKMSYQSQNINDFHNKPLNECNKSELLYKRFNCIQLLINEKDSKKRIAKKNIIKQSILIFISIIAVGYYIEDYLFSFFLFLIFSIFPATAIIWDSYRKSTKFEQRQLNFIQDIDFILKERNII